MKAVIFDLDQTLLDRDQSLLNFATWQCGGMLRPQVKPSMLGIILLPIFKGPKMLDFGQCSSPPCSIPFPLPQDLTDRFAASGWANPEIYLDPVVRNGIPSFARMPAMDLAAGLNRLKDDLESGRWKATHGAILDQPVYDAGYRFIKIAAAEAVVRAIDERHFPN